MNYTKNSGYGLMQSQVPFAGNGKTFIVGKSALPNRQVMEEIFNVDPDGTARFFATIDAAISACTANAGDVIYVLPGHTEAVTVSSIACDIAGVTIIGLGSGSLKPTLSFGATDSRINVTAANCTWKNFRWTAAVGDVVTAVLHATAAQNSQYIDIEFYAK